MRLIRDAGVPTAQPMGIVELTPEREYLIVTEFFDGAEEIGDAEVDDRVIDEGLAVVRRLWDSGIAHRDIKPANLLVKDGHVHVIDVAFVQVRPSPWREAVDLANMMLVLAVRTDAEHVYQRALAFFTPEEIAEAFAAARGIASPTQLRTMMKRDGRNLVAQFRSLAPERRPISLQRWSLRRILLVAGLTLGAFLCAIGVYGMFTPAELPVGDQPACGTSDVMILMAQSVPTATAVPCVASVPAGWHTRDVTIVRNRARFRLRSGDNVVEVLLRPPEDCAVQGADEIPSDELGMRRFERPAELPPGARTTRIYLSPGRVRHLRARPRRLGRHLDGRPAGRRTGVPAPRRAGRRSAGPHRPAPLRCGSSTLRRRPAVTTFIRVVAAIAIAFATSVLSLRLLGTRRGWGTALLATLIGWGTATVIAVGVNGWDWDVDGLFLHLLAVGIPATMAAAVILDLLARPGSLALGERAGLVVVPVRSAPSGAASPSCDGTGSSCGCAARRGSDRSSRPPIAPNDPPTRRGFASAASSSGPAGCT